MKHLLKNNINNYHQQQQAAAATTGPQGGRGQQSTTSMQLPQACNNHRGAGAAIDHRATTGEPQGHHRATRGGWGS